MHFLQDPIWQFVGAVLALITIAVTVWIYFAQRAQRRLLVEHVAQMPLMAVGPKKIPGLSISFNNHPIAEATVALVRVTNVGNTPLVAADFESAVSLTFGANAEVVHAEVVETTPTGLTVAVVYAQNLVQFERQLLNPGDSFSCRILVQDSVGKYTVSGRVVGVKEIETSARPRVGPLAAIVAGLLVAGISAFLEPRPAPVQLELTLERLPYLVGVALGFTTAMAFASIELASRIKRLREILLRRRGDA